MTGKKLELVERYCNHGKELVHITSSIDSVYSYATCSNLCLYFFICTVECYIKFGWDHLLVDPDKGLNSCQRKLSNLASEKMELDSVGLLESLPKPDDPLWTKSLRYIPQISFGAILNFSVERKVSRKKVNYLENLADFRAHMSLQKDNSKESTEELYMQTEYTRMLDKAYRFSHDGHVQDLKCHPMSHLEDTVCVVATVLASMKKVFLSCYHSCMQVILLD